MNFFSEWKGTPFARAIRTCDEACREYRVYARVLPLAFVIGIFFAVLYSLVFSAPRDLTIPAVIKIGSGQSVNEIAAQLKKEHAIRSALVFSILIRVEGGEHTVRTGSYFFSAPQNLFTVASRVRSGDFNLNPSRIVVLEGMTAQA